MPKIDRRPLTLDRAIAGAQLVSVSAKRTYRALLDHVTRKAKLKWKLRYGVVYVAEQREPVHRRVALKVIKLGMDSKQVLHRFEAERQALAMMEHGNIARVYDAGTTERGKPYLMTSFDDFYYTQSELILYAWVARVRLKRD